MNRTATLFSKAHTAGLWGGLLFLVTVAFYVVFADTFKELWFYWNDGQNWQFLIPVIFVYMLWDRKDVYLGLEIEPNIILGALLLLFSMAVLVAGQISYTHTLRELSVVFTVLSLVLLLFGGEYIRKLFWPLVYLFLMTSLPTDLLAKSSETLKLVSATVGANVLEAMGYAVYREANVLYLPHITLVVADECSGLNQLMSSIALGIPIAFTLLDKWWKRITILLFSCLFGIMANWLRVILISIWHYDSVKISIHGPSNIYQLPFIFLVGVFMTFLIALAMAEKGTSGKNSDVRSVGRAAGSIQKTKTASFVAITVLSMTAVFLGSWNVKPVSLSQDLSQFPMSIAGFTGKPVEALVKPFYTGLAHDELIASYTNAAGTTADVFIGYFQSQNAEQELVDYRYNWLHDGARTLEVPVASSSVRVKRNKVVTKTGNRTAYFVYEMNGRSLTDLKKIKLVSLNEALFHKHSNGAILVVLFDREVDRLSPEEQEFLGGFLAEAQTFTRSIKHSEPSN